MVLHGEDGYLSQELAEFRQQLFLRFCLSCQEQTVLFLAETQLLPDVEQIIGLVGRLLAVECIDQKQLSFVEGEDVHLVGLEMCIQAPAILFPAFLNEMFHQGGDIGKNACFGKLFSQ